jgi:hypothetical protein
MCDRRPRQRDPEPGDPVRAIVTDVPGQVIALSLYGADGHAAVARLSAHRALAVAAELIEAARRRLD